MGTRLRRVGVGEESFAAEMLGAPTTAGAAHTMLGQWGLSRAAAVACLSSTKFAFWLTGTPSGSGELNI